MKITLYKSLGKGMTTPILINCQGDGTKDNPIIILPSKSIPKDFIIRDYKYHIVVRGFESRYILIEGCKNILLEDTELNRLRMERCSSIIIRNLTTLSRVTLHRCKEIIIEKSFIARLRLFKSSNNTIEDNYIVRMKEVDSKNNQLQRNDIKKVQIGWSFNYMFSENSMRCAGIFMIYLFSIFLFIPIGLLLGDSLKFRLIIMSIPLSMLGLLLGVCVIELVYMGIIRPFLNRKNKRLIAEEKNRMGVTDIPRKKERGEQNSFVKDLFLTKELKDKSPQVRRAYSGFFEIDEDVIKEFGFKGKGTESNPYIICSTENLPQEIEIYKSKYFIKIIDCDLTSHFLGLYISENIFVENCKINFCEVGSCSDISFLKCTFNDGLRITRGKAITMENCYIAQFGLFQSYSNNFIKCEMNKLLIKKSRGNIFSTCKIPIELLNEENLNAPKKIDKELYFYLSIGIFIICCIVFLGIMTDFFTSFMTMGIVGILILGILLGMKFYFHTRLKKEKFDMKTIYSFPPNKVI